MGMLQILKPTHQFAGEELQVKFSGEYCEVIENDGRPWGPIRSQHLFIYY
jgi:hypothetical protein